MELSWLIPVLILLGLTISTLGSISGVGGGVLFVPLLLWIFNGYGFNEIKFVSTLLVFSSSFINVAIEISKKRFNWTMILIILMVSVPTIFLGNYLVTLIDVFVSQIIVVSLLIIVTILLIFSNQLIWSLTKHKPIKTREQFQIHWYVIQTNYGVKLNLFKLVVISFVAGLITTLTGMGGGPILMPLLLLTCGLTMKKASPISHLIIAIGATLTLSLNYEFFTNNNLNLTISLPMVIGVVFGTFLAVFLKTKVKNENLIKYLLIILIMITIVKMIIDLTQLVI